MKTYLIIIALFVFNFSGCKKYLDANPDASQVLPKDNLQNLQLLLNDVLTMNEYVPSAGEIGTDNVYYTDAAWQKLDAASPTSGNLYIYAGNVFNEPSLAQLNDWNNAYKVIFNTNLVLDAIGQTAGGTTTATGNSIQGQALFYRAFYFYQLLQEFAKPYNPNTAASDPGIVLRLTSDISVPSKRSTVQACYDQVLSDLEKAVSLLPVIVQYPTTPSKTAALALLARAHLVTGNYPQALNYAKQYISIAPGLIDYNTLSPTASFPFVRYNKEVSFHAKLFSLPAYSSSYARVSDTLYAMYAANDLRKALFFKNGGAGNISFKGSYFGGSSYFGGVANDEIYLVAAECYARTGDGTNAMNTLNTLLISRWKKNTFSPFTAISAADALQQILTERRKELVFRNLRWTDLRRLNREAAFQTTVTHTVGGQKYSLAPNDPHYVLNIPDNVVRLSGIQ